MERRSGAHLPFHGRWARRASPPFGRYHIILLGDRGTWVLATCPELLPNGAPGVEPATSRSRVRHVDHYTTKPPGYIKIILGITGAGLLTGQMPLSPKPLASEHWRGIVVNNLSRITGTWVSAIISYWLHSGDVRKGSFLFHYISVLLHCFNSFFFVWQFCFSSLLGLMFTPFSQLIFDTPLVFSED